MLEKLVDRYLVDRYIENTPLPTATLLIDKAGDQEQSPSAIAPQKLEKKILSFFGILLQLIVFYLPLLNMIFRGKAMPGIVS